MNKAALIIAGVVCGAILASFGSMTRSDVDESQRDYCRFVKDGTYPDYKGSYSADCGGEAPPPYRKRLPRISEESSRIVLTM